MATSNIPSKRQAVFSVRSTEKGSIWTRIGTAFTNKDGSLNVVLEALPVGNRLHIRSEAAQSKPESAPAQEVAQAAA
jgi:hypothetical protein